MLLMLAAWVTDPPTGPRVVWLLWARSYRPAFYLLFLLLTAGPALSWLAWRAPGQHRTATACAWCIFLAIIIGMFSERTTAMLRVLWWQVNP